MNTRDQGINKALDAIQQGDAVSAVRICRRLLRKRATDVEVLKLLGHALIMVGEPKQAAREAEKATRLDPRDVEAWTIRGHASLEFKAADDACHQLQMAVELDPHHATAWHELALARSLMGATTQAFDAFAKAYGLAPEIPNYRDNYILALTMNGNPERAVEISQEALNQGPRNPDLLHLLGQAHMMLGDLGNASEALGRAHSLAPLDDTIAQSLGTCLTMMEEKEKALPLLLRVAESGPPQKSLQWTLVRTLAQMGRSEEALRHLQERHAEDPATFGPALTRVLELLIVGNRLVQADSLIELAMNELPENHHLLGQAVHLALRRFRFDLAREHLERALALEPEDDLLLQYREWLAAATGKLADALQMVRSRNKANPESNPHLGGSLLELNYYDSADPELVYQAHREWARTIMSRFQKQVSEFRNDRDSSRKLRIGYLSPDLKGHSVAFFFEPLIRHHDRDTCEVHCYYNGSRIDAITNKIRAASEHWHQVHKDDDDRLVTRIMADEIDILVDLAGHTTAHRLEVFARRAAPIQITWLGYPNTTGLETMDYRLCDHVSDPEGPQDDHYSESLYRLPDGFLCYEGPDMPLPKREPHPDSVTFGSFNNLSKVTDTTLRLWSKVLAAAPDSRLVIKAKQLSDRLIRQDLMERLAACDIDVDRVELHGRFKEKQDHLDFYGRVDIALDAMPYNGTTTTCETLWMGIPVIALRGDRHAARVSASILTYADLPELIGEDEEDFVARAVALANDRERLATYHAGLRDHIRKSRLCDGEGFARQLESTYRELWRTYLEQTAAA